MKKLISVILCVVLCACLLTGCAKEAVDGFWIMETDSYDLGLNIHSGSAQMFMLSDDNPDRLILIWDATLKKSEQADGWVALLTDDCPGSFAGVFPDGTWVVPNEEADSLVLIYNGVLHGEYQRADIKRIRNCTVVNVDQALDAIYNSAG